MTAALGLDRVTKRFGRAEILRGVTLDIQTGERHAIIGPNGAGKSTVFNVVSGLSAPSSGRIRLNGRDITGLAPDAINRHGLARSFQITNIFPRLSVFENIRCALLGPRGYGYGFLRLLSRQHALNAEADALLARLDLTGRRDLPAGVLSYAEQRALEIGMTVAGGMPVILLDEPTAGMSRSETARIVALIRDITKDRTLVMVEHDMSVVFGLADRISVMAQGQIIATGTPQAVRADPAVRTAYLGTWGAAQDAE